MSVPLLRIEDEEDSRGNLSWDSAILVLGVVTDRDNGWLVSNLVRDGATSGWAISDSDPLLLGTSVGLGLATVGSSPGGLLGAVGLIGSDSLSDPSGGGGGAV